MQSTVRPKRPQDLLNKVLELHRNVIPIEKRVAVSQRGKIRAVQGFEGSEEE